MWKFPLPLGHVHSHLHHEVHVDHDFCQLLLTTLDLVTFWVIVEEKDVIHRSRCNNKMYYRLSHDVVTLDGDRDVSTAYCLSSSGDKVD